MKNEPWYITYSKHTCEHTYRLNREHIPSLSSVYSEDELKQLRQQFEEVIIVTKHFIKKQISYMDGIPTLILISNEDGTIIDLYGDEQMKEALGIVVGTSCSEERLGTTSISLCLKHKHSIQIKGEEHFYPHFYEYSSTTSAFHIMSQNESYLDGTITMITKKEHSNTLHLGLLSSSVDSIERELALYTQHKKLLEFNQNMINSNRNGIIITDENGIISSINDSATNIFNLTNNDLNGQPISAIQLIGDYFQTVLQEVKKLENIEITFSANKQTSYFIADIAPIFDLNNKLIGALGQFHDFTERHHLEQQVIVNEKFSAIGKLSAGLAHEIRNPLTPIMGFIDILKKQHHDVQTSWYYDIIHDELHRIKHLVDTFVITAKSEAPSKRQINIVELIHQTVNLMESEGNLKNVQFDLTAIPNEDILLYVDPSQLKQVFINLFQNAMDVMTNGGLISLSTAMTNKEININIEDNGTGMSNEELQQLFTPFFTTKEEGIGLGLSVCYRIIKNHKGTITVQSTKGIGTTFTITLPL
ncbi:ATP-binding protein [Alkalihalobacterium bogoriense]|uniref:ATP-binding protein n=1 Tax=Alkalihalobacterium bogoriense TaxID=246272 RepID=UPI00047AC093|nr:ATP-binding protein [Alkalihalobacterium bogoriense]